MQLVENGILKAAVVNTKVVIGDEVRVIGGLKEKKDSGLDSRFGMDIFYHCFLRSRRLEEVVIPHTVEVVGDKAFEHCKNLKSVSFLTNEGESNLVKIGLSAFLGCESLKNVNLPKSLKEIGTWAFALIPELIIEFNGTKEEWDNIKKDSEWEALDTKVYTVDSKEPLVYKGK